MANTRIRLQDFITLTPQVEGLGRTADEIKIEVYIRNFVPEKETRKFMITLSLTANEHSYTVTSVLSPFDIKENGTISVGSIYVLGPITEQDLTWRASFQYLE